MKKIIVIVALLASGYAYSSTSDTWGMTEWSDFCSEYWDVEVLTQDEVHDINANMMWSSDEEFQAVNTQP